MPERNEGQKPIRAGRRHVLILGGTAEASALAARLVADEGNEVITALAGRTETPGPVAGKVRIGGFGGAEGLAAFLLAEGITEVIDATHPFARQISQNARRACALARVPLTAVTRPAWQRQPDDLWTEVATMTEAILRLPEAARVFLALGRQHIAPFAIRRDCHFLLRMVDPPASSLPFADFHLVLGKPQADARAEEALMRHHRISHLVTRNSGGEASYGKIVAARTLRLPVLMIDR